MSSQPNPATTTVRHVAGKQSLRDQSSFVILALAGLLTTAAIAAIFYARGSNTPKSSSNSSTKSILLVLPFENLTNDPAQDYFSDGLTEEMITRLGSLQPNRLGVIARTTALTYKKTTKDIRQIGRELGVKYVLEGSVRRDAGRIRITSQLIQVADQTHLWAETYDRSETDVLAVQRDVATRVASSLSLELLQPFHSEIATGKTTNAEAFDAYLKGRYLITKDTLPDLERSIPYFELAISKDPGFAPAYAAELEALVLIAVFNDSTTPVNLAKAKTAALKAIEINPGLAEGYAALGSVNFWLEWNWQEAEFNLKRALELNPNNPLTRLNYAAFLLAKGQVELGVSEINEALRLDPLSLLTTGISAFCQLRSGRYDDAIALGQRMLELEPKSWAGHEVMFRAYLGKAKYQEALNTTRDWLTQIGASPAELKLLDKGSPREVVEDRFRRTLAEMSASDRKGEKVWTAYLATICVRLGEKDQAFRWLEKALSERAPSLVLLNVDPIWDPLRSDSRFAQIDSRTGL